MNTDTRTVKLVTLVATLAVVLVVCALAANAATAATDDDDAAIRENVRQMENGWNQKSGALFAKPFAENADYVVINGMHFRGREAIDKNHQRIFDTFYKQTTISLTVEHVRRLRPDIALVHVSGRLTNSHPDAPARETEARMTLIMTKDKDGWRIAAFQNTQIAKQ